MVGVGLLVVVGVPAAVIVGRAGGAEPVQWPRPVAGGPDSPAVRGGSLTTPSGGSAGTTEGSGPGGSAVSPGDGDAPYAPSSVVVSLRDPADPSPLTARGATVVNEIAGTGFVRVQPAGDPSVLVAQLRDDPGVAAASLDYGRHKTATPNDQLYSTYQQDYLNLIRMPGAWDRVNDASSQVVAVIDTGVDATHPDLAGRVTAGLNVLSPGSPPSDVDGHGTFVAGVIAANAGNGIGVAGVTWKGKVMPIKVFGGTLAFDSDIAVGIVWAVDHGARVVNLSLGGLPDSPLLHAAVRYATDRDVVVVVASGNDGDAIPEYPAAYPETIAVGATDASGKLVDFSSHGDWIDVTAPGFHIASTIPGGNYAVASGTSFAAPIVAGIAAMVRAQNPALTTAQVRERLIAAARDAGPRGYDRSYGAGVVDAARALGAGSTTDLPLPALGPEEPNDVPQRAIPLDPLNALGIQGSLAIEGDADWYRYDSPAPGDINIVVAAPGFDPNMGQNALYALDIYSGEWHWASLASQPGVTVSASVHVTAGPIYFRVASINGVADPRAYTVTLSAPSGPGIAGLVVDYRNLGTSAAVLAIGDVTGDGRNDIVGTTTYGLGSSTHAYEVFVLPQDESGGIGQPVWYPSAQGLPSSLVLADVDQDQTPDVVVGGNQGIEWFRRQPNGTLTSQGLLSTIDGTCRSISAADMNSDGITDLVASCASTAGQRTIVLTHESGSTYTASNVPDLIDGFALDTAVGDVDGDGRPDVLQTAGVAVRVHRNTAAGWSYQDYLGIGPSSVPGAPTGPTELDSVAVADVTGDGRADLIATRARYDGLVNVFAQKADGSLAPPVMYGAGDTPQSIEATDLNDDGRNDLAMINNGNRQMSIFYQRADGTFGQRAPIGIPNVQHPGGQGLAFGDINGDGRREIVAVADDGLTILRWTALDVQWDVVQSASPAEYSTGIGLDDSPRVTFAQPVDESTVDASTVRLMDGRTGRDVAAAVTYDPATRTATITPTAALHRAKPYRIVVDGVRSTNGRAVQPFTSMFVTTTTGPLAPLAEFAVRGQLGTAASVSAVVPIGDAEDVIVRYAAGTTPPASPTSGTAGYSGAGGGIMIGGLTTGQTYSFAVWYRDRSGNLGPATTATLIGTTLTMTGTSTAPGAATADVTFNGTITTPAGAVAGIAVPLVAACAEQSFIGTPAATATATATGSLAAVLRLGTPRCNYRWELTNSASYMGGTSVAVRVTAGPNAAPGNQPPRER